MQSAIVVTITAVLCLLAACSASTDAPSGPTGTGCCAISQPPLNCGGYKVGGSPDADGRCLVLFDHAPPPRRQSVDANGCAVWVYSGESTNVPYVDNCPKVDPCGGVPKPPSCADASADASSD